jgi:transposase-like protein
LRLLGEPVSAACKQLDAEVAAFHRRPLSDRYRALMLDGVMLSRRTGAGDALLEHYRFDGPSWRKAARSTNAIERGFVEVRRRTRPMGVMAGRASMDRIRYAVFADINRNQGTSTPFPLTQNS